jgi:hypothetical protein
MRAILPPQDTEVSDVSVDNDDDDDTSDDGKDDGSGDEGSDSEEAERMPLSVVPSGRS